MRRLVLKVDVDTLRGTLEGVPRLAELFIDHDLYATFLFSLGPDHSGRAAGRALQREFAGTAERTSVVARYGVRALLYGTLVPGPDIGMQGAEMMRAVQAEGFEVGIHSWDHARWQYGVRTADADWTAGELEMAVDRFVEIFGEAPRVHGAAGWQTNVHALRLNQRLGFHWCSDGRGTHPFVPVYNGEVVRCPQYPTTLPTLDELIVVHGATAEGAAERLLARTEISRRPLEVFNLHAEIDGIKLLPAVERLVEGWLGQGWAMVALGSVATTRAVDELPRHEVAFEAIAGRPGTVMVQGAEFPGEAHPP